MIVEHEDSTPVITESSIEHDPEASAPVITHNLVP
jgi:hypothetical protein